jgi:RNase adaptor protein for sRNA GlmZ degradation
MSFGFKYGVPADANYVADVRFIPNPHWVQHDVGGFAQRREQPALGCDAVQDPASGLQRMRTALVPARRRPSRAWRS